jgi:hypothetical protein
VPLLRLAAVGQEVIAKRLAAEGWEERRRRQRPALERGRELVDVELVLSDAAWR